MKYVFMQVIKAVDKDSNSYEVTPVTVVAEGTPREFLCEGKLMEAYKALNRKRNLAERELREKFGSDYEVVVVADRTDGVDRTYRLNGRSYTRHELIEFIIQHKYNKLAHRLDGEKGKYYDKRKQADFSNEDSRR